MSGKPVLVILRGLPGTGKSTLAKAVAEAEGFALIRVDTIEQALRNSGVVEGVMGPGGYVVGFAVAAENLKLGLGVVADSVNPIGVTRAAWRQMATEAAVSFLDVELVCSDLAEHRQRVETRAIDIPQLERVDWVTVQTRDYEAGPATLRIDTAGRSVETCVAELRAALGRLR